MQLTWRVKKQYLISVRDLTMVYCFAQGKESQATVLF